MAANGGLKMKAARAREDLARTGRLVLRAPALVRGAECAIRFLLGAMLAGAEIFGGWAPFGLALVGCSGSGLDGFCALVGAAFGYLSFLGLTAGLRYVAAAILIFSVSFAFYDIRLYKRVWFMPLVSSLLNGATGFVYLADSRWDAPQVIFFGTELLLTGAACYFYRVAFSPWTGRGEEGSLSSRQVISLMILAGTVLISLAQFTILGDLISLGRIAAALGVMVIASQGGLEIGAAAGVAAGLCMDIAVGAPGACTVSFGLSGLVTGMFCRQGRLLAAVAYILTNAVTVLWSWEAGLRLALLYEVFAASVLFLLLPDKLTRRVGALLTREGSSDTADRAMAYVRSKLLETSGAFQELYATLRSSFRRPGPNDGNTAAIFDRAAGRVCRRCALRDACWQRDYVSTFNALNDALPAMVDRGRGQASDFPLHFTSRCLHFPQFLSAANEELTALLARRQYQARLQESRGAVCRQYAELAHVLGNAAAELSAELVPDPAREKKLRGHLTALGLEGNASVYYDEAGHLRAELEGPDLSALTEPKERKALSALLGLPLREPEYTGSGALDKVVFTQAEPLMAVAGVAARQKDGETVSGDAGAWFRTDAGLLYILLCDGMGSGPEASRESSTAIRLLERFLKAGVEAEAALRTLNSALALRGEEEGGFTTVDLLQIDLFTGQSALYKFGAAPTYVKKGYSVRRITGTALPAGLTAGEGGSPDVTRLQLEAGDCVLLVTDGVAGSASDQWVRDRLAAFDGGSPRELAQALIDDSGAQVGAADDRTALVLKLARRNG